MDKIDIEYKTADGILIHVTVTLTVKELLEKSNRQMRSQRRQDRRRHTEYIDGLTDTTMAIPQEDFGDIIVKADSYKRLHAAINKLSVKQRYRLWLYYFAGMTQQQISDIESISQRAVAYSLAGAIRKLRKYYNIE